MLWSLAAEAAEDGRESAPWPFDCAEAASPRPTAQPNSNVFFISSLFWFISNISKIKAIFEFAPFNKKFFYGCIKIKAKNLRFSP
jgi:hypothetical protein